MPIDTTVPGSDGAYVQRMVHMLRDRMPRLDRLIAYRDGKPPLPEGATDQERAYAAFQRKARSNFAELCVEALSDRMQVVGFRTAAAHDENGDQVAWNWWQALGLTIEMSDAVADMLALSCGYMIVGWDNDHSRPMVTAEDPRTVVTIQDPRERRRVLAGLKLYTDHEVGHDVLYLFMPGRVRTAVRRQPASIVLSTTAVFSGGDWDWVDELPDDSPIIVNNLVDPGGDLSDKIGDLVPVVPFANRGGVGEFENHTDLLDRINHGLLQRMVIVASQAYRQRVFIGDFPATDPLTGLAINYDEIFKGGAGAAWRFPPGTDIKEFSQADISGVLNSVKDDVLHFAAVTRTPLHMFSPDAVSQSAEGAQLQREGLVFKAEDRIARASNAIAQVMALVFLFTGDKERGNVEQMSPMWAPVERFSLAEQGLAWLQMNTVPFATKARLILQQNPAEVAEMEAERMDDALLAPALAAVQTVQPVDLPATA